MTNRFQYEKIKEARLAAGLSQEAVARELKPPMSRLSVLRWEQGKPDPPGPRIAQLANILGVRPEFFFSNNDIQTDDTIAPSVP